MAPAGLSEIDERIARLRPSPSNGSASRRPSADDLNWVLFHSFPGSEVDPDRFLALLPIYENALVHGFSFDVELLYVRILELGDAVPEAMRTAVAESAARRVLGQGFDAADSIASIRFVIRAWPRCDAFLERLVTDPALARLRFDLTVDVVLDERDLSDYLALSYLREGDPDAAATLARFPVSAGAMHRLTEFFAEAECRRRIREGWAGWAITEEKALLSEALRARWPDFVPGDRG